MEYFHKGFKGENVGYEGVDLGGYQGMLQCIASICRNVLSDTTNVTNVTAASAGHCI